MFSTYLNHIGYFIHLVLECRNTQNIGIRSPHSGDNCINWLKLSITTGHVTTHLTKENSDPNHPDISTLASHIGPCYNEESTIISFH